MVHYPHLLSQVKLGPYVLKSRMSSANALPHFLQGPEQFPTEQVIDHMLAVAKNGAAIVTFADWSNPMQRTSFNEDGRRFPMYDLDDPSVENYLCQLTDQIHSFDTRVSLSIMPFTAPDPMYDVCDTEEEDLSGHVGLTFRDGLDDYNNGAMMRGGKAGKQLSHEQIAEIIEIQAQKALFYKRMGFDMVTIHCAYRATLFSRFISPITNKRTDEYGGDIAGRSRIIRELCARIKELCGKDFPIELQITGSEPGGTRIEETIELAKLCEGLAEVFQFRAASPNANHPTGYNSTLHKYAPLADCAAVKASGTSILCEPIGGFQDPDDMERILAEGKADLIGAARAFFVDLDFYQKLLDGRAEDIVPCVRCNKCHVPSLEGKWLSFCTVNPRIGINHKLEQFIKPVSGKKNVAVVGGGPAGLRAALFCAERGHTVTLFEKKEQLGGQLRIMDSASFKWPLVNYREYLIKQVEKTPAITVKRGVTATPDMIRDGEYDALILALGAEPKTPPVPGADKCWNIFDAFTKGDQMGKRVVVIGGSESGTEATMYLAESGHEATVLSRGTRLAPDATPIHYRECMEESFKRLKTFHSILGVTTTEIGEGYVVYTDADGQSHRIECDDVVALGGMRALQDEAIAFSGTAPQVFRIGDCREVGCIRDCNRSAYVSAMQI